MLVKTILDRCCKFKRFVYEKMKNNEEKNAIEVTIIPRKNGMAVCSSCHKEVSALYDKSQKPRRFEFIPIWGFAVYFLYCMRKSGLQ